MPTSVHAQADQDANGSEDDQPTLDELLDLGQQEKTTDNSAETAPAEDQATEQTADQPDADQSAQNNGEQNGEQLDPELETLLEGEQASDPFKSAVSQMETVAQRLGRDLDAGDNTQRIEKQILKKLDQVLAKARQQQQQQQGGGSSGSQSQPRRPQGGQKPAGQKPGQQSQAGQAQSARAGGNKPSGSSGEGGSTEARPGESLEALRKQWGSLPPRLRDELSEGLDEEFSPVYQSLTEQYYRRLAEQLNEGQSQ